MQISRASQSLAEGRRVDLVVCTGGEEGEIQTIRVELEDGALRFHTPDREMVVGQT